jgi:hypothetical protein
VVGDGVGFTLGRLFFALASSKEGAEAGDGLAFSSAGSLAGAWVGGRGMFRGGAVGAGVVALVVVSLTGGVVVIAGRSVGRGGTVGTGFVASVVASLTGGGVVTAGADVGRGGTIGFDAGVNVGRVFATGSVDSGAGVVAGVGKTRRGGCEGNGVTGRFGVTGDSFCSALDLRISSSLRCTSALCAAERGSEGFCSSVCAGVGEGGAVTGEVRDRGVAIGDSGASVAVGRGLTEIDGSGRVPGGETDVIGRGVKDGTVGVEIVRGLAVTSGALETAGETAAVGNG